MSDKIIKLNVGDKVEVNGSKYEVIEQNKLNPRNYMPLATLKVTN